MSYRKLIKGFHTFRETYLEARETSDFEKLVTEGQKPETLVIACSDSRIDPAILTGGNPGEFFSIRNVAALVPPIDAGGPRGTSSAMEFAVRVLQVKHIIILGHALCGGANALCTGNYKIDDTQEFQFLPDWLSVAKHAKDAVENSFADADHAQKAMLLEQAMILVSLENLLSFPWIKERYDNKELDIHGWYFDMPKREVLEYDTESGCFIDPFKLPDERVAFTSEKGVTHFVDRQKKKSLDVNQNCNVCA